MLAELAKLPITLSQFLKWCGAAENGAQAKELVRQGLAKVNGQVCPIPGKQLAIGDVVAIFDETYTIGLPGVTE